MTARSEILGRLRAAAPAERRLASAEFQAPIEVAAFYQRHRRAEDAAARLARFRTAIEAAHAEVHDSDEAHWPALVQRIAAAKGLRRLLVGAATPQGERLAALAEPQLEVIPYARPAETWRGELFNDIDAGLSRAKSAIAATGSLVIWTGPSEPRLLSLVPPVHFVLLDENAIHDDLHEAITVENWAGGLPTNALLISGPSKTADIQQTLAYGAHGPRELVVLLIHGTKET